MIDDDPASADVYSAMREELIGLALGLSEHELALPVPQTPAWTVRDVVAHVFGVNSDILNGNMEGLGSDAWTRRQIERRAAHPVAETCAEWRSIADATETLTTAQTFMGVRLCADLVTHIHDVLGALGRSDHDLPAAGRLGAGVRTGLLRYGPLFCERAADAGLPIVRVTVSPDGRTAWQSADGDPATELTGSSYDLLRTFSGRRSAAQIRAMRWSGDAEPFLPVISPYGVPDVDIDI